MGSRKSPSAFNFVTLLIVVALAGAGWAGLRFGPVIQKEREITTLLRSFCVDIYQTRKKAAGGRVDLGDFQAKITRGVEALGAKNVEAEVAIRDTEKEIYVSVSYDFELEMPVGVRHGRKEERTGTDSITWTK
ncbi:MAG: hypothetical protein HY791_25280 [Deltaproteobacteria bacterium]|nr:hypothetical protein [Deltaproteobacteria bacterium]